ncbi:hypothetical protein V865_004508 [Kwoniella europaea PYCC6329]|uniref:PRELI/MSF1 domain-containing protein n=1 Tax=Kwoniella europaea PYCC6329 TaxID=1423913 RepID=A0AAX4KK31_9TREE
MTFNQLTMSSSSTGPKDDLARVRLQAFFRGTYAYPALVHTRHSEEMERQNPLDSPRKMPSSLHYDGLEKVVTVIKTYDPQLIRYVHNDEVQTISSHRRTTMDETQSENGRFADQYRFEGLKETDAPTEWLSYCGEIPWETTKNVQGTIAWRSIEKTPILPCLDRSEADRFIITWEEPTWAGAGGEPRSVNAVGVFKYRELESLSRNPPEMTLREANSEMWKELFQHVRNEVYQSSDLLVRQEPGGVPDSALKDSTKAGTSMVVKRGQKSVSWSENLHEPEYRIGQGCAQRSTANNRGDGL